MKFSEMNYERPDLETIRMEEENCVNALKNAQSYKEANAAFIAEDALQRRVDTMHQIAQIRYDIDTRDAYYEEENKWWSSNTPEIVKEHQKFVDALLENNYRKDFENEYGDLLFVNAEIEHRAFDEAIVEEMKQENLLAEEYETLLASAEVAFEGKTYTLSQMTPFKSDADDARRLAAWKAEGAWYIDNQKKMDRIYDSLVHLRDAMGKKLGYDSYVPLGYDRMGRNCYDRNDVEKFRNAVQKYVVPVAEKVYMQQAERLGKAYPMNFADNALQFRSGNPRPVGSAEDILEHGKKFYDELSKETSVFFRRMLDEELMDVLSTEGKRGGGYCTAIPEYHMPFIFANFNGTQGDVEVVTHEAGHAFEAYMNIDRIPQTFIWPSMEACEVHSMSMEFFGEKWAEDFFGNDAEKFLYSHLAGALTFIPYGTMVDHFQHEVYDHPDMTPKERHACWKRLMGIYQPWIKLEDEIPFYGQGMGWQRQHHIYSSPFYYIDYCLAQTVALQFWAMIQEDMNNAWEHYMTYTKMGGSKTFTDLLSNAGLNSPFDEQTLKDICEMAAKYLDSFSLTEQK